MALPIVIAFLIVASGIAVLVSRVIDRNTTGQDELLGLKVVKTKSDVRLVARVPLHMNLVLTPANRWARTLARTSMFRQPLSGDAGFDRVFSIAVYRDDVMRVIRKNTALRCALLQLATDTHGFASLSYGDGKLALAQKFGDFSEGERLESTRENFAAVVPNLVAPFEKLPADTAQEATARSRDLRISGLPVATVLVVITLGTCFDQALAVGGIPWKWALTGGLLFAAVHFGLLFRLTKEGGARLRGAAITLVLCVGCTILAMPALVRALNSLSQHNPVTETVRVADLYKSTPHRAPSRYYLLLANAPTQLVTGREAGVPSLEVSRAIYEALDEQGVHRDSKLEVTEASGLLGLAMVLQATAL